ncbi:uncharacterized protein [Nicotiana tomentosiformis]|uniref:uncharacterized protein n=1 Tax=Nicotiana tomentosiformis TaxID=4098 RepID=UPI00051BC93D|nr:uncharacterized protein LOC104102650 [Nicotiana tomentosiformis]
MATASSSRTMYAPAMTPTEKAGNFFGVDFKRWQQKIFFYLTTFSFQRFISEDVPVLGEKNPDNERVMETSKELWNALEKKYNTEDTGPKKFFAAKFLDFKMVFNKSVITQVQEMQVIVHDFLAEGMIINKAFKVAEFIEKLPPMWKDFKNYLKHKHKKMTLEDLIIRLRIGGENKATEKKSCGNSTIMGANIVEEASTNKKRKKPSGPKNYPSKKKFKGNCHNYGKVGHTAANCRALKKDKKKSQANMIEKNEEIDDLCAMVSECNLVRNPIEWWIDSGVTRHVYANKELFTSYALAGPDETSFMANSATTKIERRGK